MIELAADIGLQAFGLFVVVCIAMFVLVAAFHLARGAFEGIKSVWKRHS